MGVPGCAPAGALLQLPGTPILIQDPDDDQNECEQPKSAR